MLVSAHIDHAGEPRLVRCEARTDFGPCAPDSCPTTLSSSRKPIMTAAKGASSLQKQAGCCHDTAARHPCSAAPRHERNRVVPDWLAGSRMISAS